MITDAQVEAAARAMRPLAWENSDQPAQIAALADARAVLSAVIVEGQTWLAPYHPTNVMEQGAIRSVTEITTGQANIIYGTMRDAYLSRWIGKCPPDAEEAPHD